MEYLIGLGIVISLIFLYSRNRGYPELNDEKGISKPKPEFILTPEFEDIINILMTTKDSIFITGKAGTGKSTLVKHFIKRTNKNFVILAPTGIAALNVSGQTVHSFFKFPPNIISPNKIEPDYVRADLFSKLEMIIIDEISMVRADLLDAIDVALRKNRNEHAKPFGGVQMVFIGDLFQLPPVMPEKDRSIILKRYGGQYFFDAPVFKNLDYHFKELTKVFRQSEEDTQFLHLLNNIRVNNVTFKDMVLLNSRHKDNSGDKKNSIFLTTRRNIARIINNEKLYLLTGEEKVYLGELKGKFVKLINESEENAEDKLPAPYRLKLKKGAQIMMLKNDPAKRWVNGTMGIIHKLEPKKIIVNINGKSHTVEKESWNEVEFVLNRETGNMEEKTIGSFTQYPIRLAYAITIHKSQGKTFEKITVDVGSGAFAHGQVYVALSRCPSLEEIILNNPIKKSDIIVDPRVVKYYQNKSVPPKKEVPKYKTAQLQHEIRNTIKTAIEQHLNVIIDYEKHSGELSTRKLSNLEISNDFGEFGYSNDHIKAFCHLRNEERNFKIDRITKIELVG